MDTRKIGILAGIVGTLSLLVQSVPGRLLGQWVDSGMPQELPLMFGTAGMTVTVYNYLFDILGLLVTMLLALGLGYTVGRQLDVVAEYRRFVGAVTVGSTLAVVLGGLVILSQGSVGQIDAQTIALVLLAVGEWIVSVSLVVTVGAVAGVALAHFRTNGSPDQPTTVDTETPARTTPDTDDLGENQSQPTR